MRWLRHLVGLVLLGLAVWYLAGDRRRTCAGAVDASRCSATRSGWCSRLGCYAAAFGLRAWAWRAVLPGLPAGQSWAAMHVSLLGNHVLPFRLGEVLRVTSVLRRTTLTAGPVIASTITLRAADVAAVFALALLAAPAVLGWLAGEWLGVIAALVLAVGVAGGWWMWRIARAGSQGSRAIRLPGPVLLSGLLAAVVLAWVLEAAVVWQVARITGFPLSVEAAVAVTAVTIAVQFVAVTPGGFGSYEAAATAVLVALGVPAGPAFGIALTTHLVKTGYALVVGGRGAGRPGAGVLGSAAVAAVASGAAVAGTGRTTVHPSWRSCPLTTSRTRVGEVVRRLPAAVAGRPVVALVVDDGSTDQTADRALAAGARVVRMGVNKGLGAAVRRGLAEAVALRPAAVVYLDADGEYFPEDIERVAAPVLAGRADYVVGSRFSGQIETMLATAPARQPGAHRGAALRGPPTRPHRRAERLPGVLAGGGRGGGDRARLQLRPGAHPRPARQGLPVRRGADPLPVPRPPGVVHPARPLPAPGGARGVPGAEAIAAGQSSTTWASKRRRAAAHAVASNGRPGPR